MRQVVSLVTSLALFTGLAGCKTSSDAEVKDVSPFSCPEQVLVDGSSPQWSVLGSIATITMELKKTDTFGCIFAVFNRSSEQLITTGMIDIMNQSLTVNKVTFNGVFTSMAANLDAVSIGILDKGHLGQMIWPVNKPAASKGLDSANNEKGAGSCTSCEALINGKKESGSSEAACDKLKAQKPTSFSIATVTCPQAQQTGGTQAQQTGGTQKPSYPTSPTVKSQASIRITCGAGKITMEVADGASKNSGQVNGSCKGAKLECKGLTLVLTAGGSSSSVGTSSAATCEKLKSDGAASLK